MHGLQSLPRLLARPQPRPGRCCSKSRVVCLVNDYTIARKSSITPDSRFPFADSFEIDRDTVVSARQVIDTLTPLMKEERVARIEEVVRNRSHDVLIITEGLYDMGNLAAVCRTADALGFGAVHCIKNREPDRFKQSKRSSAGSEKWLDVQVFDTTAECLGAAKAAGFQIVVAQLAPDAVPIGEVDWTQPTAVLLGNEKDGVTPLAAEMADVRITIPMVGFVDSYNISVAAAILMWEARRSRVERLGKHGDLTLEEQQILKAVLFLRHKGQAREIITSLLHRTPPEWQLHRNRGNWGGKEFEGPISLQKTACYYWDGCQCHGERLFWPGKACKYRGAHNMGVSTLNKSKLLLECEKRGLGPPDLSAPPPPLPRAQAPEGEEAAAAETERAFEALAEAAAAAVAAAEIPAG